MLTYRTLNLIITSLLLIVLYVRFLLENIKQIMYWSYQKHTNCFDIIDTMLQGKCIEVSMLTS